MGTIYKIAKALNFLACLAGVVALMIYAYYSWSENGEYTIGSFICSLVIHGTFGVIIYLSIDYLLVKVLMKQNYGED